MSSYIFDNAAQQAGQRFSSLETLYDPWTIRHLEATGIEPGWQCWEVGGGGGSIAVWLGERCGPTGHLLVTDIDEHFLLKLATLAQQHIAIQRHNIASDPLPTQTFDLIHTRLVLIHVPTRQQVLERMVTALKPGGWLVIEDFDPAFIDQTYPTTDAAAAALYQKMRAAQYRLMTIRGSDLTWGRSQYQRLRALGLADVGMEGHLAVWEGGSPGTDLFAANFAQIRDEAVQAGLITNEEIDRVLALLNEPTFTISAPVIFTAWGRRP